MDEAAKCNRVAFIYKGKILIESVPEDIPRLYKKNLLEVKTGDNTRAAKIFAASGAFDSVQSFGDRLHLSGTGDAATLSNLVSELLRKERLPLHSVQKIEASIEDVFVELLK